jgi:hypothetical protein
MSGISKAALALVLLLGTGLALGWGRDDSPPAAHVQATSPPSLVSFASASSGWQVGELREDGLRIIPRGRSDASAVVPPELFDHPRVREAYAIAQKIPATLNQLYCWCGCIERMGHRSALECFESNHAAFCDVCLVNAEIAKGTIDRGVTDAGEIQKAIDARVARL